MTVNHTPNGASTSKNEGDHDAEHSHVRLPRRKKWERLVQIARECILGIETVEPSGHLEIVLARIARGKGAPVPLYEVQRDRSDVGFISDPQARVFYLREQYGLQIKNSVDHSVTPAHSFYWIVLDATGKGPKMRPVEFAPEKTAKPKPQPWNPQPAPKADASGQFKMFGSQEPQKPRPRGAGFTDFERGAVR